MTNDQKTSSLAQLFEGGFRIFFVSAAFYAAATMILWTAELTDLVGLADPLISLPLPLWHAHELIFGFVIAVVAGFLTTAVPVWTGTPRVHGKELVFLFCLWLAGRLAISFSNLLPEGLVATLDIAFIPFVAFVIGKRIIAKKLWRNLGFIPLLLLIMIGNILIHLELMGAADDTAAAGIRLAIGLLILITVIIGGRVIPVFTSNWFQRHGKPGIPPSPSWVARAAILSCLIAVLANAFPYHDVLTGLLNILAGLFVLLRLSRWQSLRTLSDPIVWILHLGYGLMGMGFLFEALSFLTDLIPEILAQHVFTIGGLGVMVLGMMSRIALGHTGRPLTLSPVITAAYCLIVLALLARVIPPLLLPDVYDLGLAIAGASWILAWTLYLIVYIPVLLAPRPDGKAG